MRPFSATPGRQVSQPETQARPRMRWGRRRGHVRELQDDRQLVVLGVRGGPYGRGVGGVEQEDLTVGPHGPRLGRELLGPVPLGPRNQQDAGACTLYESSCALGC